MCHLAEGSEWQMNEVGAFLEILAPGKLRDAERTCTSGEEGKRNKGRKTWANESVNGSARTRERSGRGERKKKKEKKKERKKLVPVSKFQSCVRRTMWSASKVPCEPATTASLRTVRTSAILWGREKVGEEDGVSEDRKSVV